MALANFIYTTSDRLPELTIKDGQLIFVEDTRTIYMDMKGKRLSYNTILVFETDEEREAYQNPSLGFYFVEETSVVWRYNNGWIQITKSNLKPIFFGDIPSEFPEEGVEGVLYCSDSAIYKWNPRTQLYHLIANKNEWQEV